MSGRISQPDTPADVALRECISTKQRQCFIMVAGAGSGKTTSLIKALSSIINLQGDELKKRRQKVACITYTDTAAEEIWGDVGQNALVHVSTIHSFMWKIVSPFQNDIRKWVAAHIEEKIANLQQTAANFGPRVRQSTRDKNQRDITRYQFEQTRISQVKSFTYGTGSDYPSGLLGHDDILRISTHFLSERKLFRTLLAQQFPFVFVDESQDTTGEVVTALKSVAVQMKGQFCLGFFGDPMQRIYMTGTGKIDLEDGWIRIEKPENFRCPTSVLSLANAIRRDGDDVVQIRGRKDDAEQPVVGTARMFILPANDRRDEQVAQVREWVARQNDDPTWKPGQESTVKVLVIVHRMAANRLGFGVLYSALNDQAPDAFKNGFLDGTTWLVRPFIQFVLPLAEAVENSEEFKAITILRTSCPLLRKDDLPKQGVSHLLARLREASHELAGMMKPDSGTTVRQVLEHIRGQNLFALDPRIFSYLNEQENRTIDTEEQQDEEEASKEINSMEKFLACSASEFWGYRQYINEQSPFSTQQGIKGTEFDKVLVIVDDDEGTHFQFSYDKYFGIKALSERDHQNHQEGKETHVERTRRLFYVCCTRAMADLAVILFTQDVQNAERSVREMNLFASDQIFTAEAL